MEELGYVNDTAIMAEVAQAVKQATGIAPLKSIGSDSGTCIVMQRTSTIDTDSFRKSLQLMFIVFSDDFVTAHETGNTIVDAINEWSDSTTLDILGRPLLGGLSDDDDKAGQYTTTVDVQIPYLAV